MGARVLAWTAVALVACVGCVGQGYDPRTYDGIVLAAAAVEPALEPVSGKTDSPAIGAEKPATGQPRRLSLDECIDLAIRTSRRRPASQFGVAVAEAQHGQALSSYWPHVGFTLAYKLMDQDYLHVFPATTIPVPPMGIPVPGMTIPVPPQTVTLPANAFGPGMPPVPIPLTTPASSVGVPGQTFTVPAQTITVPKQKVKLMDKESLVLSLGLTYPLYTGGKRPAMVNQARYGVAVAREDARRTDLELVYDVKRMYQGAVLARALHQLGKDTLARMAVTLELTEKLYKNGAGRVKKTDYLRNKVMVEALRAIVADLAANERLAEAALVNTIGLEWDAEIEPTATEILTLPDSPDVSADVANAYRSSPNWAKMSWGLKAADAKVDEAKSGHLPKVLLKADLTHIENSYDAGIVNSQNRDSWTVCLALQVPLFTGGQTRHEVREARARLEKLKAQQILLRHGIALQVKYTVYHLVAALDRSKAAKAAQTAAEENRKLNVRAYRDELVDTKDVIESHLTEALMKAQYLKALYDRVEGRAHLDLVVGREVRQLSGIR